MSEPLAGLVVAMLCTGTEFATASIANEVWAVGREQFSSVVDAVDAVALASFAAETADRLGRCDLLIVSPPARSGLGAVPPEEVSAEEWAIAVRDGLTIPFLAVHAFQPVIERDGGGTIVFVDDASGLVNGVMLAGRQELAVRLSEAWAARGVRVVCLEPAGAASEILRLAIQR